MRWIDCDKEDEQRPVLRSRLVVQETRQTSTISVSDIAAVTSSTPPLEVVRLFCSLVMSMKGTGGEPLVLQFLDVSRAYLYAEVLVTISTLKLCQRWVCWKTRACLLGVAGMGCETQDRLLNLLSVIISWIMISNKGCSVLASSPIVANSCFTLCTAMITLGSECVATWKVTKRNCLNDSSSRIEEFWVRRFA